MPATSKKSKKKRAQINSRQGVMTENGAHPLGDPLTAPPPEDTEVSMDAPPPYESLIFEKEDTENRDDGAAATDPSAPAQPAALPTPSPPTLPSAFRIAVVDPVRQGEGVGAYVSYKVVSSVEADGYRPGQHEVIRRFRDFTWLRNRLRGQYRGAILPALPEKSAVEKYRMSGEFIEARRAALGVFLTRVAEHPMLRHSPDLRLFLQADETEFAIEASRLAAEAGEAAPAATAGAAGAARRTLTGAARLLRSLGASAAGLAAGAGAGSGAAAPPRLPREEEENADYLRARAYFGELEALMSEAHKQAERLVRHHGTLAVALSEFSGAMAALGQHQEGAAAGPTAGEVAASLAALSDRAAAVAGVSRRNAERLSSSFEAPMKEFMRSVRAAKKAMSDRSDALAARQAARAEVDSRRARLTRLRATPGLAEERVVEAERDLQAAMARADAAAAAYSELVQRMDVDLGRFQRERVEEMGRVLAAFAAAEAAAAADAAKLWQTIAPPEEEVAAPA